MMTWKKVTDSAWVKGKGEWAIEENSFGTGRSLFSLYYRGAWTGDHCTLKQAQRAAVLFKLPPLRQPPDPSWATTS